MQGSMNQEPIRPPVTRSATRYGLKKKWSFRGDNTKYKAKK